MGNRYTWVRMLITTVNRDRPGGHGHSWATDSGGFREPYSPETCKHLKTQTRKMQRRQHARVTRDAVCEYYSQCDEDILEARMETDDPYEFDDEFDLDNTDYLDDDFDIDMGRIPDPDNYDYRDYYDYNDY